MDEPDRIEALSRVVLLDGMSRSQVERFAERCTFRSIDRGGTLATFGEDASDVFLVLSGRLAARSRSDDGREVNFAAVEAGGLFGEFSAIDGEPRSAEIVALEASWVAQLTSARLREMVLVLPQTGLRLCELLVAKNREMSQRLFEFATMSVQRRVFATLHRLALTRGEPGADGRVDVALPPTQYEIATTAGTHRETVSREMAALARDGVIAYDRRSLAILDMAALRRRVEAES